MDDIIAGLSAAFKQTKSTSPNLKHFTIEFDVHPVNDDTHCLASMVLQSSSVEIMKHSNIAFVRKIYNYILRFSSNHINVATINDECMTNVCCRQKSGTLYCKRPI